MPDANTRRRVSASVEGGVCPVRRDSATIHAPPFAKSSSQSYRSSMSCRPSVIPVMHASTREAAAPLGSTTPASASDGGNAVRCFASEHRVYTSKLTSPAVESSAHSSAIASAATVRARRSAATCVSPRPSSRRSAASAPAASSDTSRDSAGDASTCPSTIRSAVNAPMTASTCAVSASSTTASGAGRPSANRSGAPSVTSCPNVSLHGIDGSGTRRRRVPSALASRSSASGRREQKRA